MAILYYQKEQWRTVPRQTLLSNTVDYNMSALKVQFKKINRLPKSLPVVQRSLSAIASPVHSENK